MSNSGAAAADRVIALKGVRGKIAERMVQSVSTMAQLTHQGRADATALLAAKDGIEAEGGKASVQDLLMLALLRALSRHTEVNGRVEDGEILLFDQVDLGVAIALPDGLLAAPAIFGASQMSLDELREARTDLTERAKSGKLSVEEQKGGTFTITNLGLTRVEHFTPIVNLPQIAILGVGRIVPTARPDDEGGVAFRPLIGLSLTFDHRAVNGAPAADFLTSLCKEIEEFER